jgi:hypothetical protein
MNLSTRIVLIGGTLTLRDGRTIDSRFPSTDTHADRAVHRALATSTEWWTIAASIAKASLRAESTQGFVVVVGGTSRLWRNNSTGTTTFKSILRDHLGTIEVERSGINQHLPSTHTITATLDEGVLGEVGYVRKRPRRTFNKITGSEFYFPLIFPFLAAHVMIDSTSNGLLWQHTPQQWSGWTAVKPTRLLPTAPANTMILPDTPTIRRAISALTSQSNETPAIGPDPGNVPIVVLPVTASHCAITGYFSNGIEQDQSDLEAARRLLLSRYDLKLGLWDLALNPVLRQALEKPQPDSKQSAETFALTQNQIDEAINIREKKRRALSVAKDKRELATIEAVSTLHTVLEQQGWQKTSFFSLQLPLIKAAPTWTLSLFISKTECRVEVRYAPYNQTKFREFIATHPQHQRLPRSESPETLFAATVGYNATIEQLQTVAETIRNLVSELRADLNNFLRTRRLR